MLNARRMRFLAILDNGRALLPNARTAAVLAAVLLAVVVSVASAALPSQFQDPDDGRLDLPAMAAAVTDRTRVVLVCTPNNPTGPAVRADELEQFLDAVPEHVLVVLDEAYVEFVRDPAAADGLAVFAARRNVVRMVSAIATIWRSPASWPSSSLMVLRPLRSANSSTKLRP